MIVTLTGENDAARSAELARIVADYIEKQGDMGVERLDGEEVSFERMAAAAESISFLAPQKLVILRSPGSNAEFVEKFDSFRARIADTTTVVIVEPKVDKRLTYYKQLKAHTEFREFPHLLGEALVQHVKDYVAARKGHIAMSVARMLVERTGLGQLGLEHELDKLLSYDSHITEASVTILTEKSPQSTIFDLLEAAFTGNARRVLELYEEQRSLKVEPQQIIAMLAWQFHALALVKTAQRRSVEEIARATKLKPFVIRKSQALAQTIPLARLKQRISELREFDVRTKSEGILADEAVRYFLLQLAV